MKQDNGLKFEEFTGLIMFPIPRSSWLDKPVGWPFLKILLWRQMADTLQS